MAAENPYVGPRPFERDDAGRFFGRDRDTRDLVSLIVAHRVVLLYSASGAGKSSLINAGVAPLLERKGFELLPTVRVGAPSPSGGDNVFAATIASQLAASGESIQEALAGLPRGLDEDGEPVPRALVLDQFEELFTARPELWRQRAGLFDEVSKALAADERLRVLLVVREEYLAQLEPYAAQLPGALRVRMRLDRLDRNSALAAVTGPLEGTGKVFAPGVAEELVDDLLQLRVTTASGETVPVQGEFVEPVHLQVACSRLWDDLPADIDEIRAEHTQALADLDTVLARFYEEALAAARAKSGVSERRLRAWVRDALITPGGTRSTVYRGRDETAGLPNDAVTALEEHRLVRAEQRAGALWYELTHDRLIGPIQKSNSAFGAATARRRRRRLLAAAGAGLLAIGAVTAYALAPSTKPSAADAQTAGGCRTCTAELGAVEIETGVTYGDYAERLGLGAKSGRDRAQRGIVVGYEVTLEGRARAVYPLRLQLTLARTGNIVLEQEEALHSLRQVERAEPTTFVPEPAQGGSYSVILSIYRPGALTGSQPLDVATSNEFAVSAALPQDGKILVTLRVIKSGSGAGRVVGPGIDCGRLCTRQFGFGQRVTLRALPDDRSAFASWTGACGRAVTCAFVVGSVTTVGARFEREVAVD